MRSTAFVVLIALLLPSVIAAQSPEERARIDWETAKLALQEGKPDMALEKLEKVIGVLGPLPDLLYTAAEAAFQAGDTATAQDYASRTYVEADAAFKKTEAYQKLIALSARIELRGGAFKKSSDSLCNAEFYPYALDYRRLWKETADSSSSNGTSATSWRIWQSTIQAIDSTSARISISEVDASHEVGGGSSYTVQCDANGERENDHSSAELDFSYSGYQTPARLVLGNSWRHSLRSSSRASDPSKFTSSDESSCQAQSLERVVVPAGSFDAVRVQCTSTSKNLSEMSSSTMEQSVARTETRWYVTGIGLVRSESNSQGRSVDNFGRGKEEHTFSGKHVSELLEYSPSLR